VQPRIRIGSSGWSYPSWRPGFYPEGTAPADFLAFYASRFDTVELNSTGYRLPAAEQFERWAEAVPESFRFAPKLALANPARSALFFERVARLGSRLGPVRVVVEQPRDDGLIARLEEEAGGIELAFDLRHASWEATAGVVSVNDFAAEPYRYIRLREPPYSDADLAALATHLGGTSYVYFRHEDAPTAPAYAARLLDLLSAGARRPG
jgi:uncharacterized protein YecE (DUF72 family)